MHTCVSIGIHFNVDISVKFFYCINTFNKLLSDSTFKMFTHYIIIKVLNLVYYDSYIIYYYNQN